LTTRERRERPLARKVPSPKKFPAEIPSGHKVGLESGKMTFSFQNFTIEELRFQAEHVPSTVFDVYELNRQNTFCKFYLWYNAPRRQMFFSLLPRRELGKSNFNFENSIKHEFLSKIEAIFSATVHAPKVWSVCVDVPSFFNNSAIPFAGGRTILCLYILKR
jgi:hypothetical protein